LGLNVLFSAIYCPNDANFLAPFALLLIQSFTPTQNII
jgi:hypothetical protein